jgi:hypothetical protein
MTPAACATPRKPVAVAKKKATALSGTASEKEAKIAKAAAARLGDVSAETAAKWPGEFSGNELEAQGKPIW